MRTRPIECEFFDYIVVGAGAAGCILTNRLTADGARTACLLEAGPPDSNIFLHIPAGVYRVPENPKFAWQFDTVPHPSTANRSIRIPQGRTLGGSTAINGMAYVRGCPSDFDDWAQRGNRGWGYCDVLPHFARSERRLGATSHSHRGTRGELPITDPDLRHPLCEAFIRAATSLGLPNSPDYNGETQRGVAYYQRYIADGWRISAARAFLRPLSGRSNVEIRTRAQATAIKFVGKRAVGVRYTQRPGGVVREVMARREVILCAGALNTPKLLEISGVGDPKLLSNIGVPHTHVLPGVGKNLQDHYEVYSVLRVNVKTLNGRGLPLLGEVIKWVFGRPSILASCPAPICGFINSKDFSAMPDIQLDVSIGNFTDGVERFPVLNVGFYQMKPRSRGFVHAASASAYSDPVIQPHYLLDERDQQAAINGVRAIRRLLNAPALQPYYVDEVLPGPSVQEDEDCLEFARTTGISGKHVCGSCRMGLRSDRTSVVDDQLRVHGLEGLRIADASIMPSVPSGNISAAVFMIAEKASDLILGTKPAAPTVPKAATVGRQDLETVQ